jgi:hypothetical protein
MSTDNVTVATNVIQTVTNDLTNLVAYSTTIHDTVTSGTQGPPGTPGASELSLLLDVNTTSLTDGSLLVYNSTQEVWVATRTLEKQALECGQY